MSLLIINADDFGYSEGINLGIIKSHQDGILTSTTLLANMPGFDHAINLANKSPELGIGVHLSLTCGRPVLSTVHSLTKSNGDFHDLDFYQHDFVIDKNELYAEWSSQIKKVIAAGIDITHLDSHHHVNILPVIKDVFITLAREYNLPVRNNFSLPSDLTSTNKFNMEFDQIAGNLNIWKPLVKKNLVQDCIIHDSVEAMCHPGYIDSYVFNNSTLLEMRTLTAEELLEKDYLRLFSENDITLGTFRDLRHPSK